MNKTAIKNFAIWARRKLIADISYRAGLMGITEDGIKAALPQSTGTMEFYDIGTAEPYSISGAEVQQRKRLVEVIRQKEADTDYKTAYQYIIEEVAYTWFNRLIAVRFMEVNDYLPSRIRVLSSETGKVEPDLVTTPFDAELPFSEQEKQTVIQLKLDNQLDEVFRLLFIKQCNALNDVLPNLFEKTNDYTELLLSLSVIDEEGVVYHLVHDIEEKDFNVELEGQVEIIGWLYQYYNTEPKAAVDSKVKGHGKVAKEEIPAKTQLFTPDWIVRYMVENSLGRLWVEGHPNEELKATWKYYLEEAQQEPAVQEKLTEIRAEYKNLNPEDIKVIDPCMGSGHILVYAFDVLMQIYESQGYSQRDAVQSILRHNLHGLDIDERATQLAYFSVMMKARQYDRRILTRNIQPMVYATTGDEEGENFGSLVMVDDPGERPADPENFFELQDYEQRLNIWNYRYLLAQKYDVVVTNPPYMGGSGMNAALSEFVKKNYPDTKADMFSCFIEKGFQLANSTGYISMITMESWMFLSSFEKMRQNIVATKNIVNMVHMPYLGKGGTSLGINFGTAAVVFENRKVKNYMAQYDYVCYYETDDDGVPFNFPVINERYKTASLDNFSKIPGSPVAYWASEQVLSDFQIGKKLSDYAEPKQGMATMDNNKYLRMWHEVSSHKMMLHCISLEDAAESKMKWFPYNKGGDFRKWYGNYTYLVNWENDGKALKSDAAAIYGSYSKRIYNTQYFFRPSITWSKISSGSFSVRYIANGCLFDVAGCSIFVDFELLHYFAGLLNSKIVSAILAIISPTINYEVGHIKSLPVIFEISYKKEIDRIVNCCVDLSKIDWDSFETSWDFWRHPLIQCANFTPREIAADAKCHIADMSKISEAFDNWKAICNQRFNQLKANEEELNRIFIDIYGLQGELTPEVADKDVTVHYVVDTKEDIPESLEGSNYIRTKRDEIVSLLSYIVGCMFGRYSLDVDGLAYAGGDWDDSKYTTFLPDQDNVIPITDEEYLEDDIVGLLCAWLKKVYGAESLEENLDFIASALAGKGSTSREIIRNYFLTDFFKDHCKTYQKRPIYWLFDSGKQNGFKALIYLHRYTPDTIGNLRIDYLHRMQRIYESEMNRMQDMIEHSTNTREVAAATKRKEKLQKQLKECREYDEKIGHLALSRIELDLDDGVKVNYEKVQTASDGKKYQVLAKI